MNHFCIFLLLVTFYIPVSAQTVPEFLTNKSNFCTTISGYQGDWSLIGPKSFTTPTTEPYVSGQITQYLGRIEAVWVDPSDEDHMLAASNSGGLFEWTSSSSEWVPKTNQLPGIGVNAIAVYQGTSSNIIALGTQTNNMGKPSWTHYGWGIIYSTDGGNTWVLDPDFYDANFIAWNPPPVVYALKFIPGSDGLIAVTKNKVWKKATFTGSWSNISPSVSSTFEFKDMETKVTSGGSTIIWLTGNDPAIPGAPWKLFYSVNGIWSDITSSLPTTNPPDWINVSLPSAHDAYVYFFQPSPADGYIYHYTLGGSTYTYSGNTHPGRYGTAFEVSPADSNVIYTAGHLCSGCSGDVWKSINGGTSFFEIYSVDGIGYGRHVDPRSLLVYSPTTTHTNEIGDNDKLFIGNDGGVSKTINPSTASDITNWANLNGAGLAVTQFWGFSGVEEQPNLLYGGTQDNHTFRMEQTNLTFVHGDGDGFETESYQNTSGDVLIFYQKGGGNGPSTAYRKTDGISTSTNIEPSSATANRELSQPLYKYGNTQGEKFLLGANDLFISTDDGNPSNYVSQGLNGNIPFNQGFNAITAIDVSVSNSDRTYAAFNGSGTSIDQCRYQLYFNSSSGWLNVTPGWSSTDNDEYPTKWNPITGIAMDPDDYNKVWITLDGWSYDASGNLSQYKTGSIFYSDNAGTAWHSVSTSGLPNFPILNIVFQRGSGGIVYIGTLAGIYRWVQSGANAWDGSWECFSNNLPAAVISDLEINYCAGKLRAATWGRGVWETNLYPQTLLIPETITTQTWNTSQKRLQSIMIPAGNTLTISGSTTVINMCANTYIKVMPGAKLVIDGATITNSCGFMWSGIQVVGDPTKTQTAANQGVLEMKNGAKIENAYVAVMADEAVYTAPDYAFPNGSTTGGGGIIKLDESFIEQCRNGVGFAPYPASGIAHANKSYIRLCTLSCTGLLNTANPNYTHEFISLNDVHGVQIQGNTFNGFAGAPLALRSIAISSFNATYLVNNYCTPNQNPPCNTFTHNSFNDLYRGVIALASDPSQLVGVLTIDQNIFTGCSRNIYLSGYTNEP